MTEFDKRFGADFLATLPFSSGVYLFRDQQSEIIYVGKAKNLRRRLAQYRLAKAKRKSGKMRIIVRHAESLEVQLCGDEAEALLLENSLIQQHRPRFNVAGAFSFLYPYLGFRWNEDRFFCLAYATDPQQLIARDFEAFGAFRSRDTVKAAYEALVMLLSFLGHVDAKERSAYGDIPFTRLTIVRQLTLKQDQLRAFLRGESADILGDLLVALLEKPAARRSAAEVQEQFSILRLFFQTEAQSLRQVMRNTGRSESMITQGERDPLFLKEKARLQGAGPKVSR
jgi:predicted GIY-YIG superfamily endonuclease